MELPCLEAVYLLIDRCQGQTAGQGYDIIPAYELSRGMRLAVVGNRMLDWMQSLF